MVQNSAEEDIDDLLKIVYNFSTSNKALVGTTAYDRLDSAAVVSTVGVEPCRLLTLAPELRNRVCEYALVVDEPIQVKATTKQPALLRTR